MLERDFPDPKKQSEELGGSDNPRDYKQPDSLRSCDKGSHKERSQELQPNHQEHWKKEEKKHER